MVVASSGLCLYKPATKSCSQVHCGNMVKLHTLHWAGMITALFLFIICYPFAPVLLYSEIRSEIRRIRTEPGFDPQAINSHSSNHPGLCPRSGSFLPEICSGIVKMSQLSVPTKSKGEIRSNCSVPVPESAWAVESNELPVSFVFHALLFY
jgi:hypothetical protein